MYSVIIPTMWKCDRLHQTLKELNSHPLVGEILLFDNTTNSTKIEDLEKVTHILEGKNTYVTAPWNKGVKFSAYDRLFILNDDTWMDWRILNTLYDYITPQIGLIGLAENAFDLIHSTGIGLEPINHRNGNWGCALWVHKESYNAIPEEMKIWGQDDWLFVTNRNLGKQNYKLVNFKVEGEVSLTHTANKDNFEFEEIKRNDLILKEKYNLF